MKKTNYPDWVLFVFEYGVHIAVMILVVLLLFLLLYTHLISSRIAHIEESMTYAAPRQYAPPDLESLKIDLHDLQLSSSDIRRMYIPSYSHVYFDGGKPYLLEVTLSIRNIDAEKPIYIQSVRYYDTAGKEIQNFIEFPIKLNPLQTIDFLVKQHDTMGGSGANFLVEWMSKEDAAPPLMEAVMVGVIGTRSVSFVSRGTPIDAKEK
ncbi:MAG: DUF3124 domain-containing protein [Candidatus Omnitrophica bacterium]|nr:DUF3124 domain-containing protein [Candidatus Omnitrophota bacterium]